jgi:hypothetical protein
VVPEEGVQTRGNEYLMSVGNMVAAALDPLGVDVEIHIEHHGQRSDVKKKSGDEEKEGDETPSKEEVIEKDKDAEQKAVEEKPAAELADNSDDDEWLLIRQDD